MNRATIIAAAVGAVAGLVAGLGARRESLPVVRWVLVGAGSLVLLVAIAAALHVA